jgi:hypothetical protein
MLEMFEAMNAIAMRNREVILFPDLGAEERDAKPFAVVYDGG